MSAGFGADASVATADGAAVFGWDVGGAHVKVSMADAAGAVLDVAQWACPLWQGLDHLERTIDLVFERWPAARTDAALHAVTMTGEMVDLFEDRAHGVQAIAAALAQRLGPRLRFYAGDAGWLTPQSCADGWRSVASANWLATASWIASRVPDALLIDIGSTTTDIIPIAGGGVVARAATDAGRLATGELVYQGVVRTPLCGLAQRIEFAGETVNVMNEWFATTADVYRLTGELAPHYDLYPSADQGPKTEAASRTRLARMIGRDAHEAGSGEWRGFALRWRELQLREIGANLARVTAAHPELAAAPLVGAGCGRFLAAALASMEASEAPRAYIDFGTLAGVPANRSDWAATCAPSVAIALLAATRHWDAGDASRSGAARAALSS
ncbi:hydantoinase/oxoprolinase family protein [Paraburkholderia phenazinium]|uniref:Probable H4MPT-linked C1 transfer pathway protein n=1 Tax=Paraburkholderia phenazinium TaxID=60549 RepID=A0A1N6GVJ3_9BURK|nr:hydantoinase/oxoprolinase family protein [Paraburkholderia phenazinium]SIO11385.1 probable H4MPT-linked C1 transfer pathway protein [Paraburkholderia phenazinium]